MIKKYVNTYMNNKKAFFIAFCVKYFPVVPPKYCRGDIVGLDGAQKKRRKQEGRG